MIISVNWLKKFVQINLGIDDLVKQIGAKLVEVEEVIDLGKKYQDVRIVKVVECEKMKDSDHLSVARIDDGGVTGDKWRDQDGLIQVVCGAPNIRTGLTVAWLPPEAIVPESATKDPFKLEVRKIRGVKSHGMIASPRELDLYDEHSGILELEDELKAGQNFAQVFELDDYLLEIENKSLTHRPDCFGVIGFAREVAGILGQQFNSPEWFNNQIKFKPQASEVEVEIADSNLSSKFQASLVTNIKEMAGLSFLEKTYLARVGVRPVDKIVDVGNFVMLETGEPTHAYDYDKLLKIAQAEGLDQIRLTVRSAQAGEKLELLDGKIVELTPEDVVIAVGQTPIGLAGIMGGSTTKVDQSTERIVLEAANFNLYKMRSAQMHHGVFTEAVTRFTKGQPAAITDLALARNLALITGDPQAARKFSVATAEMRTSSRQEIAMNYQLINAYLGTNLNANIMKTMLKNVELGVKIKADDLVVQVPWWRTDVSRRVEVIEEIGRLLGYDNLDFCLPTRAIKANLPDKFDRMVTQVRQVLAAAGLNEALTYSFVPRKLLAKAGQDEANSYRIVNSLSLELECYRQAILPNLLDKVYANLRAGYDQFGLFECGKIHWKNLGCDDQEVPLEKESLALVVADKKGSQTGFYLMKKYLSLIERKLNLKFDYRPLVDQNPVTTVFEPKRAAQIWVDERLIGAVGEFKLAVKSDFKLPKMAAGAEIDLQSLTEVAWSSPTVIKTMRSLPSVSRDLCFEIKNEINYQIIVDKLFQQTAKFKLAEFEISPVDFYKKDHSVKRITVRLTLHPTEKTLVAKQVDTVVEHLLTGMAKRLDFKII